MEPARILFVDDEPSIRTTLAAILNQHGFDVEICSTVREAVSAISSRHFDVLIADLNIGEPGDGFTVISAMRRTQPKCANLILTGYPAFESALRAIRAQVDDYLIKPTDPRVLIEKVRGAMESPKPAPRFTQKRISDLLRGNGDEIRRRTLELMKSDPELRLVALPDEQRVDHLPAVLSEMADLLEQADSANLSAPLTRCAATHGQQRHRQGYKLPMLVEDARVLEGAIFDVVQDHILELQLSRLVIDLKLVVDTLQWQLHESTRAFLECEQSAA